MPTVLVTGANRGIGLSLVKHLVARGDTVVATSRRPSNALSALGVRVETLDVTDEASVAALDDRLGDLPLDALVNNAGILSRQHLDTLDWAAMRAQFEVNALGPLRVTAALRHRLRRCRRSRHSLAKSRRGPLHARFEQCQRAEHHLHCTLHVRIYFRR